MVIRDYIEGQKLDAVTGKPVVGAVYQLEKNVGGDWFPVTTGETGSDGKVLFENLEYQRAYSYRITDISDKTSDSDYTTNYDSGEQVIATTPPACLFSFTDKATKAPRYGISVKNMVGATAITGGSFKLEKQSKTDVNTWTTVGTLKSDASGLAVWNNLYWGNYRITQTVVPAGYASPYSKEFKIEKATKAQTFSFEAVNTVKVTGLTLNNKALSLAEGENSALTATVTPSNATDKSVTWSSSNAVVATVDGNGKVTAKSAGTAVITATSKSNTAISSTCTVTVKAKIYEATSVTLNPTTMSLVKGNTGTITATVLPANAADKTLTWRSSNTYIATVDKNGKVASNSVGTATITATTANGKTASCVVTVTNKEIPITSVSVTPNTLTLTVGDSGALTAAISPANATGDTRATWSSSNAAVASVNGNGSVTASAAGVATITAKTANGKTASCTVTVKTREILADSISFGPLSSIDLVVGQNSQLYAEIYPENTTNKSVTWNSDRPDLVTVDSDGRLTSKGVGTARITATTSNGKSVSCPVNVKASSVTLDLTAITLNNNEALQIVASPNPSGAMVSWSSADSSVATVENGLITAHNQGETVITASITGASAICRVLVVPKEIHETGVEGFVERLYTVVLGRASEPAGKIGRAHV